MAFQGGGINPALLQALQQRGQVQQQQPISTGPTRSQLVAQLLQRQAAGQPRQISSIGEGLARLSSRLVDTAAGKRRIDEQLSAQESRQQAMAQALQRAQTGDPDAIAQVIQFNPQFGAQLQAQQQTGQARDEAAQARLESQQVNRQFQQEQQERGFTQQSQLQSERLGATRQQQGLRAEKEASENQAKVAAAATKADRERFDSSSGLRKEATAVTSDFRQQKAAIQRIRNVSFDKQGNLVQTPAASLALVFNFMKVLDPGSVVRESEFKTAEQARGTLTRLQNDGVQVPSFLIQGIQRIEGEGSLLPEQIRDFNAQAEAIFLGARETALDDISPIIEAARANNFQINRIFSKSLLEDIEGDGVSDISKLSDEDLLKRLNQ